MMRLKPVLFSAVMLLLAAAPAMLDAKEFDPMTIPLDKYVTISPDGHLSLEGKRVRFWGWIGHFWMEGKLKEFEVKDGDSPEVRKMKIEKTYRVYDAMAQRISDLGFNLVRCWNRPDWGAEYEPGDGSSSDFFAFTMNALDKRGIKVWMTGLGGMRGAKPDDAGIIKDTATEAAWRAAVGEKGGRSAGRAYAWDKRLLALSIKNMQRVADWKNKYKGGLRIGDDPQIAVWEFTNEEWFIRYMVNGQWQELPPFFQDELRARWCAWLAAKYKDDAGLAKAWSFLLPGESLTKASVALAPLASPVDLTKMVSDANPGALDALTARKQQYGRGDFVRQRGADVLEFLAGLHIAYKTAQRDAARKMGRGLGRVPILFDTGDHFNIQTLYLNQHADAVAKCTYSWAFAPDRQSPRFPWLSGLDEYPRTSQGETPWAEEGRIPGKPFFIYETQINNPSKYRCEYPYRLAALAAIQDMDIVCWHLFGRPNDPDEERPYEKQINYSMKGLEVEGVHYKNDEIYSSVMRSAGYMFRNGALDPVKKPTVMTFGKNSLYDPASMDYGASYGNRGKYIAGTVYRYGLAMRVDTSLIRDKTEGETAQRGFFDACPVKPTSQIAFDWKKGNLVLDAPSAKAFTGFYADYGGPVAFSNGIRLSNVTIVNPKDIAYPMKENEKFISFGIIAVDGQSLDKSRKVMVSLVSTSFNTGFKINEDSIAAGKPYDGLVVGDTTGIKPPVQIARVSATLQVPMLDGMKYEFKDWHFRTVGNGTISKGQLRIPADVPVFYAELTR